MSSTTQRIASTVAALALSLAAHGASAQQAPPSAQDTYRDIEQTLGTVPGFLKAFPESGITGAWAEMKSVQLNQATKLSGKEKELIGLAVAAQIPCSYCIYFHTQAAKLNGASDDEIREAVAMAAITRHWSTVFNGMQIDQAAFREETNGILKHAAQAAKTGGPGEKTLP